MHAYVAFDISKAQELHSKSSNFNNECMYLKPLTLTSLYKTVSRLRDLLL